jgi:hypothetical protein
MVILSKYRIIRRDTFDFEKSNRLNSFRGVWLPNCAEAEKATEVRFMVLHKNTFSCCKCTHRNTGKDVRFLIAECKASVILLYVMITGALG